MKIAIVAAGFSPSEADKLRRAMATFRKVGTIGTFQQKMVDGMVANGYDATFAERCFRQIEGFGEYGFPESHAASFALLVYASSWMKCHYPDVFAASLLNAQPLGFYAPAQIVRDAREHGIDVRAVDINLSTWDATLEKDATPSHERPVKSTHAGMADDIHSTHAVRLGFREIKGLKQDSAGKLVSERGKGYDSVRDLWLRTGLDIASLERLADADAFGSLGLSRRDALWAVKALGRTGDDDNLPLFASTMISAAARREPDAHLPPMPLGEEVVNDYRFLRLSLKAHPAQFVREHLARRKVVPNGTLNIRPPGRRVSVSGLVLVRQRPGSAKGVIFMTLEDETGVANTIVWPKVFERFRPIVLGARFVIVSGRLQNEAGVVHVVVDTIEDATDLLTHLSEGGEEIEALARGDEVKRPQPDAREKNLTSQMVRARRRQSLDGRAAAKEVTQSSIVMSAPKPHTLPSNVLPLFSAADLDVPARATRHVLPKGRNFR